MDALGFALLVVVAVGLLFLTDGDPDLYDKLLQIANHYADVEIASN
ncbi:hypothetical protein LCGC14_2428290 [marine sediment metagenome]|uniref:Uncharacterized protein n=1 Tax=marine sediment metagenome TaxID=412755 RepID=A0A0F9BMQ2_9ZZZZ